MERLGDALLQMEVDAWAKAIDEFPQDFFDYVCEGKPLTRKLTRTEELWLSRNLINVVKYV